MIGRRTILEPYCMHHFSDNELSRLDEKGVIPGPGETIDSFAQRVKMAENPMDSLKECPLPCQTASNADSFPQVLDETARLYGIRNGWVPLFYSRKSLRPWEGATTWYYHPSESSVIPIIQLSPSLARQKSLLFGLYEGEEILAHELAHAGRVAFDEYYFEEVIAYQTSTSKLRRLLGGLVLIPFETLAFLLVIVGIMLLDLFLITSGRYEWVETLMLLKAAPALLLGMAFGRSLYLNQILQKAKKRLEGVSRNPLHFLYRLTDKEIFLVSRLSPEEIRKMTLERAEYDLRWRVLGLHLSNINK